MDKALNWMPGNKTYSLAVLMFLVGLANMLAPDVMSQMAALSTEEPTRLMAEALGLAFLRKGVASVGGSA